MILPELATIIDYPLFRAFATPHVVLGFIASAAWFVVAALDGGLAFMLIGLFAGGAVLITMIRSEYEIKIRRKHHR